MRDSYFDNAKFLLIVLVVIGHTIESQVLKNSTLNTLYLTIYTFHMPVFIMISGYFAKNYNKPGRIKKLAIQLLVPYMIFNVFVALPNIHLLFYYPSWTLWFILSLFTWNVLLPLFVKLKHPIVISLLVALGIGYLDFNVEFLSLSRTFALFPFFLMGFYLKREHFNFATKPAMKAISIVILFGTVIAMARWLPDYRWLHLKYSYAFFGHSEWYAAIYRIGIYGLTAIVSLAFLSLIPTKQTFFTHLGTRTLTVYLLHTFAIRAMYLVAKILHIGLNDITLVCFAIVFAFVLSTRFVQVLSKPIIEPNFTRLSGLQKHLADRDA